MSYALPDQAMRLVLAAQAATVAQPSDFFSQSVALDKALQAQGVQLPVAFSATEVLAGTLPPPTAEGSTIWHAQQLLQQGQEAAALASAFTHAKGVEVAALQVLLANMALSVESLWLRQLNKYLAFFHPSHYRLRLGLGRQPRFMRLQAADAAALPKVEQGPVVSVLMPFHNAQETLALAVRSILQQTWQPLELWLIDDASTDGSLALAHSLAATDARIRVLPLRHKGGPYIAKNVALPLTKGEFVTVHDADDWAMPTRLADQLAPLLGQGPAKVSMGYSLRMTMRGEVTKISRSAPSSWDGVLNYCHPSPLFNTAYFREKLGAWDSALFGGDTEIMERVMSFEPHRLIVLTIPVMFQLDAPGTLTRSPATYVGPDGAAPIRDLYRQSWKGWHAKHSSLPRLEFPQRKRIFAVPEGLQLHSLSSNDLINK